MDPQGLGNQICFWTYAQSAKINLFASLNWPNGQEFTSKGDAISIYPGLEGLGFRDVSRHMEGNPNIDPQIL